MRTPDPRIRAILQKIEKSRPGEVSVGELARSVQLSPSRFSHLFALQVGMPPGKYLRQQLHRANQAYKYPPSV